MKDTYTIEIIQKLTELKKRKIKLDAVNTEFNMIGGIKKYIQFLIENGINGKKIKNFYYQI